MLDKSVLAERVNIAGISFDFLPQDRVVQVIGRWRQEGRRNLISITNPHSVMMCRRDPAMRAATVGAGLTLPDGVGIVVAARILGYGRRQRVTGPALMLELCDEGRQHGFRHYFYGGGEGIADRLARNLTERFPGLEVAGSCCPPFRALSDEEDVQTIQRINASRPDIVWVGLGAPKQEKWMAAHTGKIAAAAMIGVGAAFDFHSGNVPWAPELIRRCGLEWAYRLTCEPRRMWRRNLDSPLFLMHVLAQASRIRMQRLLRRPPAAGQELM